jgi:hypothetical protein
MRRAGGSELSILMRFSSAFQEALSAIGQCGGDFERNSRMKRTFILLLLVLTQVITACSGGAEEAGLATLEAAGDDATEVAEGTANADVDAEEALMAFSQCMRDNGIPDYPDPTLNADGSIGFGFVRGGLEDSGIDPRSEEFGAARDICAEHLEGIALGRGGEGFDETELTDTLLAFAQCMRDHGVPMDDPDLSGFGPGRGEGDGGGPFADIDFDDPEVQEAFEACQEEVNFTGPGGGGFGGGGRPGGGGGE